MKTTIAVILVSCLISPCFLLGQSSTAGEGTQITSKPAYTVVPTKTPPTIDGKIDDAVWQAAKFTELYAFVPLTEQKKTKADPATTFALSADSKNLYVAFRCMDPDMGKLKKIVTERDGKGMTHVHESRKRARDVTDGGLQHIDLEGSPLIGSAG